jgi:solute carrier family 6 amino acid/orphan transporter-like 15/16/17/18/20
MLTTEGIPVFYLELEIGQRLREGVIGMSNQVSPYLSAVGTSSAAVSCNVALYHQTVTAWCLFYFVQVWKLKLSQRLT